MNTKVNAPANLNYNVNVLSTNKRLKEESKKLGYCVKTLLRLADSIELHPTMLANLQAIDKDSELYKQAAENVRRTKLGNYSPFTLLQYLYKISK